MKCPECKKKNEAGAAFCEKCGAALIENETWLCGGCDTPVPASEAFCPECGAARPDDEADATQDEADAPETADEPVPSEEDTESTQKVKPVLPDAPEEFPDEAEPCGGPAEKTTLGTGDLREVLLEIERRQWRVGQINVLNFRLTNLCDDVINAGLSAEIAFVKQLDKKTVHDLAPESIGKLFGLHFKTSDPGLRIIKGIQLRLQRRKEDGEETRIYCVPDDSMQIDVLGGDDDTRRSIVIQGDMKLDIHDLYACDGVNVSALEQLSEKKKSEEKSGVFWQPVRMIFDPEATKAADARQERGETRIVQQKVRTLNLREVKLEIDNGKCMRKTFLFAKESINIGRDPVLADGTKNDIALRSIEGNPIEDRKRTRAISRRHGKLFLQGNLVQFEDVSSMGTYISRKKIHRSRERLPEVCTLNIAGMIKLKVRIFRAKSSQSLIISKNDSVSPMPANGMTGDLGMENEGEIDAIRLRRQDDMPHEYVMLARQGIVGSNREDPIFITGKGVEEIHARILYYKGEFLIRSETQDSPTLVDGYRLRPDEHCPLAPGNIITLGETEVIFDAITPEDYKHV